MSASPITSSAPAPPLIASERLLRFPAVNPAIPVSVADAQAQSAFTLAAFEPPLCQKSRRAPFNPPLLTPLGSVVLAQMRCGIVQAFLFSKYERETSMKKMKHTEAVLIILLGIGCVLSALFGRGGGSVRGGMLEVWQLNIGGILCIAVDGFTVLLRSFRK